MQRGEHPRERGRPVDVAHQLPLAHAEHARVGEHRRAHFLDALIDVEEHDEEHQRDAERDFRRDAEPEPEREDRRQHDARQRVDHLHVRVEHRIDHGLRANQKPINTPASEPITKARIASTSVIHRCFQIVPSTNHLMTRAATSAGREEERRENGQAIILAADIRQAADRIAREDVPKPMDTTATRIWSERSVARFMVTLPPSADSPSSLRPSAPPRFPDAVCGMPVRASPRRCRADARAAPSSYR